MALPREAKTLKPHATSVMTVGTKTMKEQMQEMGKMLEQVLKDKEKMNKKLDELRKAVNKLYGREKLKKVTCRSRWKTMIQTRLSLNTS